MSRSFPTRRDESGQVLALFALMLVVLCGFSALAIDVTRAYSVLRDSRSVADAASLAGAQELQIAGTRNPVTNSQRRSARQRALLSLRNQLGQSTDPGCGNGNKDIVNCTFPETGHIVSIRTPSPSCSDCDPNRSVQVTVRVPSFQTSFARVLGQPEWDLGITSVAGMGFTPNYGVVALRPPNIRRNGTDANMQNIELNGTNTRFFVFGGDIGTNTSAVTNSTSYIDLESGYFIYHIDDITPDPWNKDLAGEPEGRLLTDLIEDPLYPVPVDPSTTYARQRDGLIACAGLVPPEVAPTECYQPGTYQSNFTIRQNTDIAYLLPGVYSFQGDVSISGTLIGGRDSSTHGVVIKLRQNRSFTGNNAVLISLNEGSVGCADAACRPATVVDENGTRIETPLGTPLTIVIPRDGSCFSGTIPVLCSDNQNDTITLPGNGQLAISGVIYAPSDFIRVNGDNSASTGSLGKVISWRISYSGGARLTQDVAEDAGNGVLRLDAACSAPGEPCN